VSILCKIKVQKKASISKFLIYYKGMNGKKRILQQKVYDSLIKNFD
jgi:hypothetical protein